ncbi:MAG: PilZ domain-containing protein [Chloroflexota bacterium]
MNQDIFGILVDLAKSGEKMTFYNTYKSMPVCFEAEIIKISHGTVSFKVHKYQALCIKKSGFTIIRHPFLPKAILAKVVNIDFTQMIVGLYDFQYLTSPAGNRQSVRVEPEKPFGVFLKNGNAANAFALDISESGLGVSIKKQLYLPAAFGQDKLIVMEFRYPNMPRLVTKMKGIVTNVVDDYSEDNLRLGIHMYPDKESQQMIADYVKKRQAEILDELESFNRLVQMKTSP